MITESSSLEIGKRVQVYLTPGRWRKAGWRDGTIIRIDPYSAHRSFHWVELDVAAEPVGGGSIALISILNPRHIRKA